MNRRRVLERVVQAFSITGLGFIVYPFIKAGLPAPTDGPGRDVDVSRLAPGKVKLVNWLGRRVLILRRSPDMVRQITEWPQLALKDPDSSASSQPAFARNPWRSRGPEIFVAFTNCTHLGCEVMPVSGDGVGFRCPCHRSDYDYAGRVLRDAAAPLNLEVPDYRLVSGNTLRLEKKEA
ncbi:MAG: ubiquinol-cytochrome c reductase iron-sulfur subunit [Pseudohongiellaceae bacterium]